MPKVKTATPKMLQPFTSHGLDLSWREGGAQATSECPFCGAEAPRFSVEVETSKFRCWSCRESGNASSFLSKFHALCAGKTGEGELAELAEDRGLLSVRTLTAWGVCRSLTLPEHLLPSYNADGALNNLYRYNHPRWAKKRVLQSTAATNIGMFGVSLLTAEQEEVWVVESWNALALWEVLGVADDRTTGVVGVSGCCVFQESWCPLFAGRRVVLGFDSDRPKPNRVTGKDVPPAGLEGCRRTAEMLLASATPPVSVSYVCWGPEGYDSDLPDGYDIRDALTESASTGLRVKALGDLRQRVQPVPDDWVVEAIPATVHHQSSGLTPLLCCDWVTLRDSLRRAIKSRKEIEDVFVVTLAVVASTSQVGDQIFLQLVASPGCLHGDTPIYDPTDRTNLTVAARCDLGISFNVWSKEEDDTVSVRAAMPPHRDTAEPMYRVTMMSGNQVTVTKAHRFWTDRGFTTLNDVCFSDPRGYAAYRLPSISELSPSVHGRGVQHSTKTTQGYSESCCVYLCPCGEQPLTGEESSPDDPPSPVGARTRTQQQSRRDDPVSISGCTDRQFDHLSTVHSVPPHSPLIEFEVGHRLAVGTSSQSPNSTLSTEHTPLLTDHPNREVHTSPAFPLTTPLVSTPPDRLSGCSRKLTLGTHQLAPLSPSLTVRIDTEIGLGQPSLAVNEQAWETPIKVVEHSHYFNGHDEIVKVEQVEDAPYYDFHVPETENYWACGVFHHNSAKTVMCDALLVSKNCFPLEDFNSFYSGYKGKGGEDCSLISRINHKTLITPEADVIMSSTAFDVIMSQQRRIFDGSGGKTFGNDNEDTRHSGLRTPWIMAGTPAMLDKNQSRLGDRFIKVVIGDPTVEQKRDILRSVGYTAIRSVMQTSNGDASKSIEESRREFYQLTGGYVDWLRSRMEEKVNGLVIDHDWLVDEVAGLAEFAALMRGRPAPARKDGGESHDMKELPSRLTSQFARLACCVAVVLNKLAVDDEVMGVVRKVAVDTGMGRTMNIVRHLHYVDPDAKSGGRGWGRFLHGIARHVVMGDEGCYSLLNFMKKQGIVESFSHEGSNQKRWRLTETMESLFKKATGE